MPIDIGRCAERDSQGHGKHVRLTALCGWCFMPGGLGNNPDDLQHPYDGDAHRNAPIHISKSSMLKHLMWNVAVRESTCMSLRPRAVVIAA